MSTRDTDHFAGRCAVLECIKKINTMSPYQNLECSDITYEVTGRPYFKNDPQIGLSISHSYGWGASSISKFKNIAIDIEKIRSHDTSLFEYVIQKEELDILSKTEIDTDHLLTITWTMKESIMKALGLGLIPPHSLILTSFLQIDTKKYIGLFFYKSSQNSNDVILWTVRTIKIKEFFISVAYPTIFHETIILNGYFKNNIRTSKKFTFN